jgi:hypothetical protein
MESTPKEQNDWKLRVEQVASYWEHQHFSEWRQLGIFCRKWLAAGVRFYYVHILKPTWSKP